MKLKTNSLLLILIFSSFFSFSQEKFTLSGTISDKKNNETLIGVNVIVKGTKMFTSSNEYGFYSLTLPQGEFEISISYSIVPSPT